MANQGRPETFVSWYNQTITRRRPTVAKDGFGEEIVSSYSDYDFIGSLQNNTGDRQVSNNLIANRATHRLYCDTSHPIVTTDVISYSGITYNILSIENKNSHHFEILLEERS